MAHDNHRHQDLCVQGAGDKAGQPMVIVHLPPPMRKRAFYLMLARAKQLEAEGEQVLLTHCGLRSGTCFSNVTGNPMICAACRFSTRNSVRTTGLPLVTLSPPAKVLSSRLSLTDQKELAAGVRSALISIFRVLTKDLNRVPKLRSIKRRYYRSAVGLLEAWNVLLDKVSATRVEVPNGRMACTKFVLVGAKNHLIPFNALDYNGRGHPMLFSGHGPHDRKAIQARIMDNPAAFELAERWFTSRHTRSGNKFAARHQTFCPPEIDGQYKKRVTFFLSSQDECESLGRAWWSPFRDNASVVEAACLFHLDFFFCVRFHPNQAGILSDVTSDFRRLEQLPNLKIFYPNDPIDTYQLVAWSNCVVVFQSTVALEACWMGKPVIQLGPSFYDALGIAETPANTEEFLQMLHKDLQPHSPESVARFAHYAAHDYDALPHLAYQSGKLKPIGFRRAVGFLAKPAKEYNTQVVRILKRSIKYTLELARKSRRLAQPTEVKLVNQTDGPESSADGVELPRPRVLIHVAYPLWRKHLLLAVARGKELQELGHDVTMTHCNARGGTCAVNYGGSPVLCQICRSRVKSTVHGAGLKLVSLEIPQHGPVPAHEELVEGVQSGITSTFRTLPKDSDALSCIRDIKRRYLQTASGLLTSMRQFFNKSKPDLVEVFNGRHACSRFALIAAREANVPFNTFELTATKRPIIFQGHTAHDRKRIQQRMLRHPADFELAEQFFEGRRQPRKNRFVKGQKKDFIPPSAEGFEKKVTFFLSSQDEFESLGEEWQSPFSDYATVIDQFCAAHPDYLFCVRFHPNQADIASDIVTPFRQIAGHKNLQIYYPNDTANTYELIDWSDIVVTFGSTVTVEACWMRKPVILLGPSFYDEIDVSYTPATIEEAHQLVRKQLACKDRANAARFASYFLTDGDSLRYVREGKHFEPRGFRVAYPVLGQLARLYDNAMCHVLKARVNSAQIRKESDKAA